MKILLCAFQCEIVSMKYAKWTIATNTATFYRIYMNAYKHTAKPFVNQSNGGSHTASENAYGECEKCVYLRDFHLAHHNVLTGRVFFNTLIIFCLYLSMFAFHLSRIDMLFIAFLLPPLFSLRCLCHSHIYIHWKSRRRKV